MLLNTGMRFHNTAQCQSIQNETQSLWGSCSVIRPEEQDNEKTIPLFLSVYSK